MASRYRQPQLAYWVKLQVPIYLDGHQRGFIGEVYKVVQYLEEDGRYGGKPTIRVKIGRDLVGLHNNEFVYCNEQGEVTNEKINAAV